MPVPVTVLGSGAWGTALGFHLARQGHEVALWTRTGEFARAMAASGENHINHPGIRFPPNLRPTADLRTACQGAEALLFVCPSHAVRTLATEIEPLLSGHPLIITAAKGIEQDTRLTMSAVLAAVLADHRDRVAALSGPSFAREVAQGMPTAVTAAAHHQAVAE